MGIRQFGTWLNPDLYIWIGPWAARVTSPYYGGMFGNGSRWFSGWYRWRDQPDC